MFGLARDREQDWTSFEAEAVPLMADVFRVARWLGADRATAEDLTQETLVQALKSFHRYTPVTNCRAWLMTILYRVNGKRISKLGRLRIVDDPDEIIMSNIAGEPPVPARLTGDEVISAFATMPQKFREVVLLADVEEFTYKEVSEVLRVPIGTVMSRLHRGRRLLRAQLADHAQKLGIAVTKAG